MLLATGCLRILELFLFVLLWNRSSDLCLSLHFFLTAQRGPFSDDFLHIVDMCHILDCSSVFSGIMVSVALLSINLYLLRNSCLLGSKFLFCILLFFLSAWRVSLSSFSSQTWLLSAFFFICSLPKNKMQTYLSQTFLSVAVPAHPSPSSYFTLLSVIWVKTGAFAFYHGVSVRGTRSLIWLLLFLQWWPRLGLSIEIVLV